MITTVTILPAPAVGLFTCSSQQPPAGEILILLIHRRGKTTYEASFLLQVPESVLVKILKTQFYDFE
jgi:hypothetical protein